MIFLIDHVLLWLQVQVLVLFWLLLELALPLCSGMWLKVHSHQSVAFRLLCLVTWNASVLMSCSFFASKYARLSCVDHNREKQKEQTKRAHTVPNSHAMPTGTAAWPQCQTATR